MTENESLLEQQVAEYPSKKKWGMKVAFVAIIFFGVGALIGNSVYQYYNVANSVAQYEKDYAARLEAEREAKMADTYGGKTPAETLSLYIEAVKKGDYELASKYFVEKYRQRELDSSSKATPDGVKKYLDSLEAALVNIKNSNGSYSPDKIFFGVSKPVLVDFELYPNGVWKLIEI